MGVGAQIGLVLVLQASVDVLGGERRRRRSLHAGVRMLRRVRVGDGPGCHGGVGAPAALPGDPVPDGQVLRRAAGLEGVQGGLVYAALLPPVVDDGQLGEVPLAGHGVPPPDVLLLVAGVAGAPCGRRRAALEDEHVVGGGAQAKLEPLGDAEVPGGLGPLRLAAGGGAEAAGGATLLHHLQDAGKARAGLAARLAAGLHRRLAARLLSQRPAAGQRVALDHLVRGEETLWAAAAFALGPRPALLWGGRLGPGRGLAVGAAARGEDGELALAVCLHGPTLADQLAALVVCLLAAPWVRAEGAGLGPRQEGDGGGGGVVGGDGAYLGPDLGPRRWTRTRPLTRSTS